MLTRQLFLISMLIFSTGVFADSDKNRQVRKDPTRPPNRMIQQLLPALEAPDDYQLSAVFRRDEQMYAVINGELLHKGQDINGMKVDLISLEKVVLTPEDSLGEQLILTVDAAAKVNKQVVK